MDLTKSACCLALLLIQVAAAQERIELQQVERVDIDGRPLAAPIVVPVKCDSEGNPFLLFYDVAGHDTGPVMKVFRDGSRTVRFGLEATPELIGVGILDFAPGARGEVYLLGLKPADKSGPEETHVITFDADGKFRSKHKLDLGFRLKQIAAFSSGDFLIAGREIPNDQTTHPLNAKPFVGIFNARGQLVKRVKLRDDVEAKAETRKTPLGEEFQAIDRTYEKAIGASLLEASDDGNIYLMRQSPTGPVYVISAAGVLLKTIKLVPPGGASLWAVKASKGRLVAQFLKLKANGSEIEATFFDVMDLDTEKTLSQYSTSDARVGSAFACYAPDSFTFVGNDGDGHLALVRAKPH